MTEPILYVSLYFKQHRAEYYECLQRVRFDGDWEHWVRFFMRGVLEVSNQAVDTAKAMIALVEGDRARIRDELRMSSSSALRVLDALSKRPITSAKDLAKESAVSIPTALSTLSAPREKGMAEKPTLVGFSSLSGPQPDQLEPRSPQRVTGDVGKHAR